MIDPSFKTIQGILREVLYLYRNLCRFMIYIHIIFMLYIYTIYHRINIWFRYLLIYIQISWITFWLLIIACVGTSQKLVSRTVGFQAPYCALYFSVHSLICFMVGSLILIRRIHTKDAFKLFFCFQINKYNMIFGNPVNIFVLPMYGWPSIECCHSLRFLDPHRET